MNVIAVDSTTLSAVAYDAVRGVMLVQFRDKAIYGYFSVPLSVYEGLLGAVSKGSYFNQFIRGGFRYARVWSLD